MYFFCMRIAVKTLAYYKSIKLFSSVNKGFHIFGCLHQTRMGIKAYSTWNSAFHRLHDTHTHVLYIYTEQRHVRHDWDRSDRVEAASWVLYFLSGEQMFEIVAKGECETCKFDPCCILLCVAGDGATQLHLFVEIFCTVNAQLHAMELAKKINPSKSLLLSVQ